MDAWGNRSGASEHGPLASGHRGSVALRAELPIPIDETAQRRLAREHEDQGALVEPDTRPSLPLQYLHERVPAGAAVDHDALACQPVGERQLHAERAEHREACGSLDRAASTRRTLVLRRERILLDLADLLPCPDDTGFVGRIRRQRTLSSLNARRK